MYVIEWLIRDMIYGRIVWKWICRYRVADSLRDERFFRSEFSRKVQNTVSDLPTKIYCFFS